MIGQATLVKTGILRQGVRADELVTAQHCIQYYSEQDLYIRHNSMVLPVSSHFQVSPNDLVDIAILRVANAASRMSLKVIKPRSWPGGPLTATLYATELQQDQTLFSVGRAERNYAQESSYFEYEFTGSTAHGWSGSPLVANGALLGMHTAAFWRDA